MKVTYIGIVLRENSNPQYGVELCAEKNLEGLNWIAKPRASSVMTVGIEGLIKGTGLKLNSMNVIDDKDEINAMVYALSREGICGIVVADHEYPGLVAQSLAKKITDEFLSKYPRSAFINATKTSNGDVEINGKVGQLSFPELKDYITKYQNPEEADSIAKIQKELAETKVVLHNTIASVLERGEKIDNLVAKSDHLNATSKLFYTQAKKQNSCCTVM